MIQKAFITQWGTVVPWSSPRLVEQDLIICRALVSIFSDPFLKEHLAFRGGTALHKLYLEPQPRYSEDIDLVQVNAEPIKETMDHLREALSWLGEPVVKQKKHNNTLVFRVQPTDLGAGEIHLKVEINCKEHFSVFPMVLVPFSVEKIGSAASAKCSPMNWTSWSGQKSVPSISGSKAVTFSTVTLRT